MGCVDSTAVRDKDLTTITEMSQPANLEMRAKNKSLEPLIPISSKKTIRILSIDGGGVRGILPCVILRELERQSKKHPSELFDLIVGTSIGGIIALSLTTPGKNKKKPKMSVQELLDVLMKDSKNIFEHSLLKSLESLDGLLDEKYDAKGLEEMLQSHFEEATLRETLVPVMCTSFELEKYKSYHFKSWDPNHDFLRKFVGRATSAAPIYFSLAKGNNLKGEHFYCIDGGVVTNNPSLLAYIEAKKLYPNAEKFVLVSIGTGKTHLKNFDVVEMEDWGAVKWVSPLLDIIRDANNQFIHKSLKETVPDTYFRLQPSLTPDTVKLDNSSKSNVEKLCQIAEDYLTKHKHKIEQICKLLEDPQKEATEKQK